MARRPRKVLMANVKALDDALYRAGRAWDTFDPKTKLSIRQLAGIVIEEMKREIDLPVAEAAIRVLRKHGLDFYADIAEDFLFGRMEPRVYHLGDEECATYEEYRKKEQIRREIISENRSRLMRGLPRLKVPEKPLPPLVPICYEPDGTYAGRVNDPSECPEGYIVKWERATR